jgi:hypothetical protein
LVGEEPSRLDEGLAPRLSALVAHAAIELLTKFGAA